MTPLAQRKFQGVRGAAVLQYLDLGGAREVAVQFLPRAQHLERILRQLPGHGYFVPFGVTVARVEAEPTFNAALGE